MSAAGFLRRPLVLRGLRIVLGALFLAAALAKIGDAPGFALQVHNFRIAPAWSENGIAILLPWIELVAGLALVTGYRARAGAVVALALLVAFTLAVASAWARGLDFECGCFGKAIASRIGATKFVENTGWIGLAFLAARTRRPTD